MLLALALPLLVAPPPCAPGNAGLTLPPGLCATVVLSDAGAVRQMAVAPNGDLFVAVVGSGGGVIALRDADGDGRYETTRRFGSGGGNGIALTPEHLYFAPNDRVLRWAWAPGQLEPKGDPEVVVSGLPTGGHTTKHLAVGPDGKLYVTVGSRSNSCQVADRQPRSPGHDPCSELETRAGIWRFDPARTGQTLADGERYATGIRNGMALGFQPGTSNLFVASHGRDQLSANWGFSDEYNAETPAEELAVFTGPGGDLGWPYCYYDWQAAKKVLAPEYGGDGKQQGRCAGTVQPGVAFPGHWGPMALAFAGGTALPAEWREGVFVAFHGSWNRAPLPQAGYRVAFAPMKGGRLTGEFRDFAVGTAGPTWLAASGVAVGPDGSVFIAADRNGTIWRVVAER